ncbi:MAG: hypothetical protein ACE14T_05830 [Syntrophales bacterium]
MRRNTEDICKDLMKEFEATLVEELIPGILHNFANPLNGIMGRSKLLQRRLQNEGSAEDQGHRPAFSPELFNKLTNDINLISRDTDKLTDLLQTVAEKFYTVNKTGMERINLSELIRKEMSFFEFYLEFRHNIKKNIDLDRDIPEITGIPAEISLSLWSIIRFSMQQMKDCEIKELSIATRKENSRVCIDIRNTASGIGENSGILTEKLNAGELLLDGNHPYCSLLRAFFLLKKYDAGFTIGRESGSSLISITIPYRKISN